MLRFALLLVGFFVLAFNNVEALNQIDRMKIYTALIPTVKECSSKHGVSEEVIKQAEETKNPENLDQCFIACVLKKAGVINDGGQFDIEKSKELISKYVSDAGEMAKAQEIVEKCASVNDQLVDSECDRPKLLMDCLLPYKKEFEGSR